MSAWLRTVGNIIVAVKNYLKAFTYDYGLEILLFGIALGNAEVLHQYLLDTGSNNTWQLTLAIYCTEILVVWASLWRTVGLGISFVLFWVSMVSISSVFNDNWFGHSGFSLAIFSGSVGNYVRRGGWKELGVAYDFIVGKQPVVLANVIHLVGLSVNDIRLKLNCTLAHANLLKSMVEKGIVITDQLVEQTKC